MRGEMAAIALRCAQPIQDNVRTIVEDYRVMATLALGSLVFSF